MMKRRVIKGLLAVVGLSLCALLMGAAAPTDTAPPPPAKATFYKDVLPILQNNCQSCHRPGEVAPMSLLTYEDARPWSVAIKMAVLTKKMPPWYADPEYGHFSNERKLTGWLQGGHVGAGSGGSSWKPFSAASRGRIHPGTRLAVDAKREAGRVLLAKAAEEKIHEDRI